MADNLDDARVDGPVVEVDDRPLSAFYGRPLTEDRHDDPDRPAPGFTADRLFHFSRAMNSEQLTSGVRESLAVYLADQLVNRDLDDYDRRHYAKVAAEHEYARAVYRAEAERLAGAA